MGDRPRTSNGSFGNDTGDLPQEHDATFLVVCPVMGDGPQTLYEKRHQDAGKVAKHYPRVFLLVTLEGCRAPPVR